MSRWLLLGPCFSPQLLSADQRSCERCCEQPPRDASGLERGPRRIDGGREKGEGLYADKTSLLPICVVVYVFSDCLFYSMLKEGGEFFARDGVIDFLTEMFMV